MQTEASSQKLSNRVAKKTPIYAQRGGAFRPGYCPATSVKPPSTIRVHSTLIAPENPQYQNKIASRQSDSFSQLLLDAQGLLESGYNLGCFTDEELAPLVSGTAVREKYDTLQSLAKDVVPRLNKFLHATLEDVKQDLVNSGLDKAMVEHGVKESEESFLFALNDEQKPCFVIGDLSTPLNHPLESLGSNARAASILLNELVCKTYGAMPHEFLTHYYFYGEMTAVKDTQALASLLDKYRGTDEVSCSMPDWLRAVSAYLVAHGNELSDEIDEMIMMRTELLDYKTLINDPERIIAELKDESLEWAVDALFSIFDETLSFSKLSNDMTALLSGDFQEVIDKESPHYEFLSKLYAITTDLQPEKGAYMEGLEIANDFHGVTYFYFPFDYDPKYDGVYEMCEEIVRHNMEADENCVMLSINDFAKAKVTIKNQLKIALLNSMLQQYAKKVASSAANSAK
jgi:hypothetical protein